MAGVSWLISPLHAEIDTFLFPGGATGEVQYNDRGIFDGSPSAVVSTTTGKLQIFSPPGGSTTSFRSYCSSATHVGRLLISTESTSGQWVFVCESSGNWVQQGGSGGGGSGTPGGLDTQLQYNNAGSFGGIASATFSVTTNVLTIGATTVFTNVSTTTWTNVSTITFSDGLLVNMAGINMSANTEGLRLPQSTDCSNANVEGLICWDTDDDLLYVGGSAPTMQFPNRSTLTRGTTVYPDFVYAGSSLSVSGNLFAQAGYFGTGVSTFSTLNVKANSTGDAISIFGKTGAGNGTITILDYAGLSNTRIEGGNNPFYGDYFEAVHLNTPTGNYKGVFSSSTTGVYFIGYDAFTGLQPYQTPTTITMTARANSTGNAIRTMGHDPDHRNSDWTFTDSSGVFIAHIEGGVDASSGNYITMRLFNSPTLRGLYISSNTGTTVLGTPGGNDAADANYGFYVSSFSASPGSTSTGTNQWFDVAAIPLTSGDWDIWGTGNMRLNGSTSTRFVVGISSSPGNDGSFLTGGSTAFENAPATAAYNQYSPVPPLRFNFSTAKTYYLKAQIAFSAGSPQAYGFISARRAR